MRSYASSCLAGVLCTAAILAACGADGSTSSGDAGSITPTSASDTILFVGDTLSAFTLLHAASGQAFVPASATSVTYVGASADGKSDADALGAFGRQNAILVDNGMLRALAPGAITVTIADEVKGWRFTARVAALPDIRQLRHTRSICLFATSTINGVLAYPARVTNFDAPSALFALGDLEGHPRWLNGVPSATVYLAGTQTDSSVDYYPSTVAQPVNRRVIGVTQRQMVVTLTATAAPLITMSESASGHPPYERQTTLAQATTDIIGTRYASGRPSDFCQTVGIVVEATSK